MSKFNLSRWALAHQQLVGFVLALSMAAGLAVPSSAIATASVMRAGS